VFDGIIRLYRDRNEVSAVCPTHLPNSNPNPNPNPTYDINKMEPAS